MKNKDDIKTFIVIICVCVVCVIAAVILSVKNNVDELEAVSEYNVFFSNVNYVNSYIDYVANGTSEAVYALLDERYIADNGITYIDVLDYLDSYSNGSYLKVTSMEYVKIKDNFIYYIKGSIWENSYDGDKIINDNFAIVLKTDFNNLTFSLYPVDEQNYENVINDIKKIEIADNEFNSVSQSSLITKEQVCVVYLSDFLSYLKTDIDKSYNLLSDEMKIIYTDIDSYTNYINDNYKLFSTDADKCMVQNINGNRVYSVIDSNGNNYVFTEESVMNYKVDFYLSAAVD